MRQQVANMNVDHSLAFFTTTPHLRTKLFAFAQAVCSISDNSLSAFEVYYVETS